VKCPGLAARAFFVGRSASFHNLAFTQVPETADIVKGIDMTQINPFIGSILQSTTVQRAQSAEKDSHVQRVQNRAKDSASNSDTFEHQVESSDALSAIHDEDPQHPGQRKQKHPPQKPATSPSGESDEDGPSHIDVKV
jgi:hypothetical protein